MLKRNGSLEVKPGEYVDYTFSNIKNLSNTYLDNFKWYDYIPTDYVRLEKMTTGIWNQDLLYNVYYKTNESDKYILFKENLKTTQEYELDFTELEFNKGIYITEICYEFGKVDIGFREIKSPTIRCKTFKDLKDEDRFTNYTKTVGIYGEITAEATDEWTTIVHKPKEIHPPVLPRTGE